MYDNRLEELTVREARERFLAESGFSLDDYGARWVRLDVGPFAFHIPNTKGRQRAVPLHDLHHVATGYATDIRSEFETAAWELAAGCGGYLAAWVLNLPGAVAGLLLSPRRALAAWRRGRACRSLYRLLPDGGPLESILDMSVGELRALIGLTADPA